MRGVGGGQGPTDPIPGSFMINAAVSGITSVPQGQMLKVTYKGGDAEAIVGPDTPIVTYVPGDASLSKPRATIYCVVKKKADGSLTATRIIAEKDGVEPQCSGLGAAPRALPRRLEQRIVSETASAIVRTWLWGMQGGGRHVGHHGGCQAIL